MAANVRAVPRSFLLLLLLALPVAQAAEIRPGSAPGTRFDVGKHHLHLYCIGSGTPTVVMDSGLGGTFLDWALVQPEVSKYTRVCTYDRAGYGWSDSGPLPRSSLRIASELRVLLRAAEVPGPYVLVGHSFGGYNMRLFAGLFPRDTAALILVDAAHEEQIDRFRNGPRMNVAPRGQFVVFSPPSVPAELPEDMHPLAHTLISSRSARSALRSELAAFERSAMQVAQASKHLDVPLVVVTRGKRVWPRSERGDLMEQVWREMQDNLASRSDRVVHMIAEHAGHYVHLEQPEVVLNAIRVTVDALRAD
jgi:pimeloyl-ACP methyl ester carboxylesterase